MSEKILASNSVGRIKKHKCIYSGEEFERASAEHILQNFLGARWDDASIVCDRVQTEFSQTIDSAFERGIRPIRALLGTKSGRRNDAPPLKGLSTIDGKAVALDSGGKPLLERPHIQIKETGANQHEITMEIDPKHIGWALAELRKKFPQLKMTEEELLKNGKPVSKRLESPVKISISFGGNDYIRGALKAGFNLLAARGVNVLDGSFDQVREFILKGAGLTKDFFRWPKQTISGLPKLGPIDHFLGIQSRGNLVVGVLNVYGYLPHSFRFTSSYTGPQFKIGYLVDPLRQASPAEDRRPSFIDDVILRFADQPEKPGPETWAAYTQAVQGVMHAYGEMSQSKLINEALKKALDTAFGNPDGRVLTQEDVDAFVKAFSENLRKFFGVE